MKAIALLSGGLDSTLAIKIIIDQGVEIEAINFFTPFCQCSRKNGCGSDAKKVADTLNVKIKIFNVSIEYFEMIKNPKYGYGKNLNPCIDCRVFMHKKAKDYMEKTGASFVITGEVLGQRPMSQHRQSMDLIEKESGLEGLILRPLSAKLLSISIPEKKGWVNREKLLDINGRCRKSQIALAKDYNISNYSCPAGGCLLTDFGFVRRMKDLMKYSDITLNEVELLKVGRHFRLSPKAKLIVGRNKEENAKLLRLAKKEDICFVPVKVNGPIGIGLGCLDESMITLSSTIIARYSDSMQGTKIKVSAESSVWKQKKISLVSSISNEQLNAFRI